MKIEIEKYLHGSKLLPNQITIRKNGIRISLQLLSDFNGMNFCRIFYDDENPDILEIIPTEDERLGRAMKISNGSGYIDFKKASELKLGVYTAKVKGDKIIAKYEEAFTEK